LNHILFAANNPAIIVNTAPEKANIRLAKQEGLLLTNLSDEVVFFDSLLGMLMNPSAVDRQVVSKKVLSRNDRIRILKELERMGIREDSLFPDPDYEFSEALKAEMETSIAADVEASKQSVIEQTEARKTVGRSQGAGTA
jgi:hypothetical protein